jgi:hypothetical protein
MGLREWVENPTNLDKFMSWVYNNKISMAIHVRKLDKIILENKEAYKALQKGATLEESLDVMKESEKRKTFSESVTNVEAQMQNLYELVKHFPRSRMLEIAKDDEQLKEFETLHKEFGQLIKDIKTIGNS